MNQPLNPQQASSWGSFMQTNPVLKQPGHPLDSGRATVCAIDRVMLAGGHISSLITPDSIVPLEYLYRRLPEDGVFSASPNKPFTFEVGAFQVPANMAFVLIDSHFNIYRPNGVAAGDFVPLESNRLSTQVGWDIKANAQRQGNTHYELNPLPPQGSSPAYQSNPNPGFIPGQLNGLSSDAAFEAARASQAQGAGGDVFSILPQRHNRQGLTHAQVPWVVKSDQTLATSCRVMRAIQIPIAFFEAEIFGFLMPSTHMDALQKAVASCLVPPGGV